MVRKLPKSSSSLTDGRVSPRSSGLSKHISLQSTNAMVLPGTPIPDVWNRLVPEYQSKVLGASVLHLLWEPKYADEMIKISSKRVKNRCDGYLDLSELDRASKKLASKGECAIRFGAEKRGHGYSGERGDFCLVGGVVRGSNLAVFYRSLEMIGGFAYDLCVFDALSLFLKREFQTVTIYTTKAFVFALKGNSNEKLYPKLKEIFRE